MPHYSAEPRNLACNQTSLMISKIWNTSVCIAPPFHPHLSFILSLSVLFFSCSLSLVTSLSLPYLSCLVFPCANLDKGCAVGIWPLFKGESQSLCKYVHVCRLEWLYVSSTEAVCIFRVRIFVACSDVSQSHEASPLAIQQSFNPHHQRPQTPASDLSLHRHTGPNAQETTHTHAPCAPSISSDQCRLVFKSQTQRRRMPSTLLLFTSTNHHTNFLSQTSF